MPFLFEGLEVYKKSLGFVINIYALNGSLQDKFIKDQLRRASLSIPLNIAEGQGRLHTKEKKQFYNVARGSVLECVSLIQISLELRYIESNKYQELYELATEISKMLCGLLNSIK